MLAVLFEMPARCKKTLLLNLKPLLKHSKQGSLLPCTEWFLIGVWRFRWLPGHLWHTTHVSFCACRLLTSPTLTPTRPSFPGSGWPGPRLCAPSTSHSLYAHIYSSVFCVCIGGVCPAFHSVECSYFSLMAVLRIIAENNS